MGADLDELIAEREWGRVVSAINALGKRARAEAATAAALHPAIEAGATGAVKALVTAGADLNTPPPDHSIDRPGPALWTLIASARGKKRPRKKAR